MINELNRLGNNNAELILTAKLGYRTPYRLKPPHSWCILDNEEIITWVVEQIKPDPLIETEVNYGPIPPNRECVSHTTVCTSLAYLVYWICGCFSR